MRSSSQTFTSSVARLARSTIDQVGTAIVGMLLASVCTLMIFCLSPRRALVYFIRSLIIPALPDQYKYAVAIVELPTLVWIVLAILFCTWAPFVCGRDRFSGRGIGLATRALLYVSATASGALITLACAHYAIVLMAGDPASLRFVQEASPLTLFTLGNFMLVSQVASFASWEDFVKSCVAVPGGDIVMFEAGNQSAERKELRASSHGNTTQEAHLRNQKDKTTL
ncbi:uncharacterized protein B0H18DRAFT_1120549 [Fomitopsis serialis]|uniref:uncharacterized protein n=1 Tax=Fomitopsis serialis TaxID=139415 RepID=UPI002008145D|nr:uncharacterized protein B0H18DRAFT_1120549 [Neoantrodia serialis]KAH9923284.1 hypothetical protein B0H18DRAFT_1120549 [Neoantrodia serialis]